jgi:hypothetical protein
VDQYRCCPHNYGQGWPYYVEKMWLATPDCGLAAALYGASTVSTTVTGGRSVTATEQTTYPFGDTITFTVAVSTPVAFPFSMRIPGWCSTPRLSVNDDPVTVSGGPKFATAERTLSNGDVVRLELPAEPRTTVWATNRNSMSIDHGALAFSARIDGQWTQVGGTSDWPPARGEGRLRVELRPGPQPIVHAHRIRRQRGRSVHRGELAGADHGAGPGDCAVDC